MNVIGEGADLRRVEDEITKLHELALHGMEHQAF
jgi:hypothetical protein